MSTTLKRTSMALDQESLEILDSLSSEWQVSKAEVIRRSLKHAREVHASNSPKLSPAQALESFRHEPALTTDAAESWMKEVRAEREARRDPWAESLQKLQETGS